MAKTIKEMSKEYATKNYAIHNGKTANPLIVSKIGFEAGANAVLEEIEKCLDEKYAITSFYRVKEKIKKLKVE